MKETMYYKLRDQLLLMLILVQVAQAVALLFVWAEVRDLRADVNSR